MLACPCLLLLGFMFLPSYRGLSETESLREIEVHSSTKAVVLLNTRFFLFVDRNSNPTSSSILIFSHYIRLKPSSPPLEPETQLFERVVSRIRHHHIHRVHSSLARISAIHVCRRFAALRPRWSHEIGHDGPRSRNDAAESERDHADEEQIVAPVS